MAEKTNGIPLGRASVFGCAVIALGRAEVFVTMLAHVTGFELDVGFGFHKRKV